MSTLHPAELTAHHWTTKAYAAEQHGFLPDWLRQYLNFKNKPDLLDGITCHTHGRMGPLELSLSGLHRIVGMAGTSRSYDYPEQPHIWQYKIDERVRAIEDGFLPPPLIVVDWLPGHEGYPAIGSGNHDADALIGLGIPSHTAIVYMAERSTAFKIEPLIQPAA